MTTQTPTAPASEAGKCQCCLRFDAVAPICAAPDYETLTNIPSGQSMTFCVTCGHDEACHTTNRADPGPVSIETKGI